MRTDRTVTDLVAAAREGDAGAWNALVDRYAGLVISVCRRHRLSDSDAADVSQTVWLRLVEQLPSVREPEALPGWLVTTTRHECFRLERHSQRHPATPLADDVIDLRVPPQTDAVDEELARLQVHAALRDAFAELAPRCQQLLLLLLRDPAPSYGEISQQLGMPVGSIGPTRARCLDKLRRSPAVAALTR